MLVGSLIGWLVANISWILWVGVGLSVGPFVCLLLVLMFKKNSHSLCAFLFPRQLFAFVYMFVFVYLFVIHLFVCSFVCSFICLFVCLLLICLFVVDLFVVFKKIKRELTFTPRSPLPSPAVLLHTEERSWPPHYHLFIRIYSKAN